MIVPDGESKTMMGWPSHARLVPCPGSGEWIAPCHGSGERPRSSDRNATAPAARRLSGPVAPTYRRDRPATLAVVPLTPDAPAGEVAAGLAEALSPYGPTLHLNSARLPALLGQETTERLSRIHGSPASLRLYGGAGDHSAVVLQADPTVTPWTRCCLARADRVLLVAAGAPAGPSPLGDDAVLGTARRELVLWHDAAHRLPHGTGGYLDRWPVAAHHQLRAGVRGDMERLARHLSGRAVGLVLGGGAARTFAHLGALRALHDAALPIDAVGGTSAGAVLAAQYAMGWDLAAMESWCRELARGVRKWRDVRLPLFSLLRGRALDGLLDEVFGTTCIEDLWLPYYCVSSNLTRAAVMIHRRGPLRQYTRASCALPGLLPPVHDHGDLLADGAVLNNLPVEPMRELCAGGPVVAVDVSVQYRLDPTRSRRNGVRLVPLLRRAAELASVRNRLAAAATADIYVAPAVGDVGLLETSALDRLIESGYHAAVSAIAAWQAAHPAQSIGLPDTRASALDDPARERGNRRASRLRHDCSQDTLRRPRHLWPSTPAAHAPALAHTRQRGRRQCNLQRGMGAS